MDSSCLLQDVFYLFLCVVLIIVTVFYLKPHLIIPTIRNIAMFVLPVKKRHVELKDGLVCTYHELGSLDSSTESVLYLHGFTESAGSYLAYFSLLMKWQHVVFLTLLNHGDSTHLPHNVEVGDMVSYINQFLQHSGLHARKFHIAGFSLGGCVAIHYTALHPDKIASMFLLNPYGLYKLEKDSDTLKVFNHLSEDIYFESDEAFKQWLDYMSNQTIPLPQVAQTVARHYRNSMSAAEGNVLRGVLKNNQLIEQGVLERLARIPVLCVQGEKDVVTPKEGVGYLKQHVPHARLVVIPEGSHLMTYTHIKKIVSLLKEWVQCRGIESRVGE